MKTPFCRIVGPNRQPATSKGAGGRKKGSKEEKKERNGRNRREEEDKKMDIHIKI